MIQSDIDGKLGHGVQGGRRTQQKQLKGGKNSMCFRNRNIVKYKETESNIKLSITFWNTKIKIVFSW